MAQIRDVMSKDFVWVPPETTLREAAQMMRDHDIGFLPVGENDRMVGVVTDRDIVRFVSADASSGRISHLKAIKDDIAGCDDQDNAFSSTDVGSRPIKDNRFIRIRTNCNGLRCGTMQVVNRIFYAGIGPAAYINRIPRRGLVGGFLECSVRFTN